MKLLSIQGMTCGGWVAAVNLQLKRTGGVPAYEVSYEDAEAQGASLEVFMVWGPAVR